MARGSIMLGSKIEKSASPMFWKSGVIRKICLSPKSADQRSDEIKG